jgi:hypothetical protein
MMKVGGWTNSLHSFVLWLPAVLASALSMEIPPRHRRAASLVVALAATIITCVRVKREPDFPVQPQLAAYHEAARIAARFPGAVWFPVHPLVTLYSDHRYYHDEDGMYTRIKAHQPLTPEHLARHLPPAMQMMAFRNNWNDWHIARGMLPPGSRSVDLGYWTLRGGVPDRPLP